MCYQPTTTFVLTPGWSLGEPTITGGPCASAATTLTWNDLDHTDHPTQTIPESSESVFFTYQANITTANQGDTLTNGAEVSTTIPEDPDDFPNSDSEDVTIPQPDPYVTKDAPLIAAPGEKFSYTIGYGNNNRETALNTYIVDTLPDEDSDGSVDIEFVLSLIHI
mgnify:FL=1